MLESLCPKGHHRLFLLLRVCLHRPVLRDADWGKARCLKRTTTTQNETKIMNDKFDELTKNIAQSVTRRGALKKFGAGLVAMTLASLAFPNRARAGKPLYHCQCQKPDFGCSRYPNVEACMNYCFYPGCYNGG